MTFGDKFTSAEVDNAFGEFSIEDGMIDAIQLKGIYTDLNSIYHTKYCVIEPRV